MGPRTPRSAKLARIMAMMQFQMLGLCLSLISLALWIAALTLHVRRNLEVTRYAVYGGIGLVLTLFSVAALDGGGLWSLVGMVTLYASFSAILVEAKAARDLRIRRAADDNPKPPEPIA